MEAEKNITFLHIETLHAGSLMKDLLVFWCENTDCKEKNSY